MRSLERRWPAAGFLVAALCLAVMSLPGIALAQDKDNEDNDDAPQAQGDVRVYHMGGEEDDADGEADVDLDVKVESDPGGYLGVGVQDVTRELQQAKDLPTDEGALVNRIDPSGPADGAGIRRGDVIVEVNKKTVTDSGDLIRIVRATEPGTKVPVVVIRNGSRKTIAVEVAPRPMNVMVPSPRGGQHMTWKGMPPDVDMRALQGLRMQRDQILQELNDIQEQLSQLRQTDITRLQEEIQALRDELARQHPPAKSTKKAAPKP